MHCTTSRSGPIQFQKEVRHVHAGRYRTHDVRIAAVRDRAVPSGARPERGPRRVRVSRQTLTVLAVIAVLLGIGALLGHPFLQSGPYLASPTLPWWVLALAFAATESIVLHIQRGRQARSVSMSELPLVLGFFFATPLALLVGRLVGCAVTLVTLRRCPPLKTFFNLALFAAETAVSVAVFSVVSSWGGGHVTMAWVGAYAGVLAANVLGGCAIGLVISVHDGGIRPVALVRDACAGQGTAPMVVTLGLVAVTSLAASTASAWLLIGFGALLLLAYRGYAALSERHLNLERLYRFSQAVSTSPEIDQVMTTVLGEARELLRSERASAAFVGPDGGLIARVRLGASGRLARSEEPSTPEDDWVLQQVVQGGQPLLMPRTTRDPDARRWLASYGMREAVAVPLTGASGVVGVLVVADRQGDVRTFVQNDVLLLETVANQAGVALRNGELIGQLRHEALHDALTGLPNRTHLQRCLGERWTTSRPDARAAPRSWSWTSTTSRRSTTPSGTSRATSSSSRCPPGSARRSAAPAPSRGSAATSSRSCCRTTATRTRCCGSDAGSSARSSSRCRWTASRWRSAAPWASPWRPTTPTTRPPCCERADMAMYDAKTSTRGLRLYEPGARHEQPAPADARLRAALRAAERRDPGPRPAAGPALRRPGHAGRGAGPLAPPRAG